MRSLAPPLRPLLVAAVLAVVLVPVRAYAAPSRPSASVTASVAPSSQLNAAQAQAAQARAQLDAMRSQLATRMSDLTTLTAQIARTRAHISETATQVARFDAAIAADQQVLGAEADRLYRSRGLDAMDLLLGTTSLRDFIDRADFLVILSDRDSQVLADLRYAREQSAQLQAELEQRNAQLVALKSQADADRSRIESAIASQQAYVDSLDSKAATLLQQQDQARRSPAPVPGPFVSAVPVGGASWMTAPSLRPGAWATVDSRPGERYLIPPGQATRYTPTGVSFDWVSSTYGNADNSPPNSTASASGRPFQEYELTCANKELPFGTLLAVSCNGRHVIVVVTDRGPYIAGRSLDLSTAAAHALGFDGVVPVHVEVVVPA